jgi:hypothetical protein
VFALSFSLGTVASGQLIPAMVNLPQTPLQFVSINSDAGDYMEAATLKNVSGREISSFQIGLIMSIPAPCAPTPEFGAERVLRVDRVIVPAGQTAITHDYGVSPLTIKSFDKSGMRRIVLSQISVTSVTFSDGGSWQSSRDGRAYDDASIERMAKMYCSATVAGGSSREQPSAKCGKGLKTVSLSIAEPGPLDTQSFNCVCDNGYGCSVSQDDKSCLSTLCSGDFCQNQICHPADSPTPTCPTSEPSIIQSADPSLKVDTGEQRPTT